MVRGYFGCSRVINFNKAVRYSSWLTNLYILGALFLVLLVYYRSFTCSADLCLYVCTHSRSVPGVIFIPSLLDLLGHISCAIVIEQGIEVVFCSGFLNLSCSCFTTPPSWCGMHWRYVNRILQGGSPCLLGLLWE